MTSTARAPHPFIEKPNRTLLTLMFPVLLSLIAEPLTGLVDTAFIKQLGAPSVAALGVAATGLSTLFWVFNFLDIGTQTSISQSIGAGDDTRASNIMSVALAVAWSIGMVAMLILIPFAKPISQALGAQGEVLDAAVTYIRVRSLGIPAILTTMVCFGTLRGTQDMRTPSFVAIGVNVMNITLDYPLIFGWGVIPALGVGGAALASVMSQYVGAAVVFTLVLRKFGFDRNFGMAEVRTVLRNGGNLSSRTGLLTLFLLVSVRQANVIGVDAGAANQVLRQVYGFTAFALDAFAISTQSLVGFFVGAGGVKMARKAAWFGMGWSFGTGVILALVMLLTTDFVIRLLVPASAVGVFLSAWYISAALQPLNALAFATDGIHWGTGDYAFLRNAMLIATGSGVVMLLFIPTDAPNAFTLVWLATVLWIVLRSVLGVVRFYPGIGKSPLKG